MQEYTIDWNIHYLTFQRIKNILEDFSFEVESSFTKIDEQHYLLIYIHYSYKINHPINHHNNQTKFIDKNDNKLIK